MEIVLATMTTIPTIIMDTPQIDLNLMLLDLQDSLWGMGWTLSRIFTCKYIGSGC
jgi:hypothetical protein